MKLDLTEDQALVLFDWLARLDDADNRSEPRPSVHEAERVVLWAMHGQLESTLVAPLRPDYSELLRLARERTLARWHEHGPMPGRP